MKITEAKLDEILRAYNDPNLQQAAVEFVGLLKKFDKTEDDNYIYLMDDVANRVKDKIPYDEVMFNDSWTTEPSFVLMATVMKMIRLDYLPSLKKYEGFWLFLDLGTTTFRFMSIEFIELINKYPFS